MSLSILILGAPFQTQSSYTAYRFTKAALELNHPVHRVFFYQSAIHTGTQLACPPRDEFDLYVAWRELKKRYDLDLVICIAAAARRGLIDQSEAKRHHKPACNIAPEFELAGLGQLIDALSHSERLLTFGS